MHKAVSKYIAKQESPQKEICRRVRKIILKAFPKMEEEMQYGVPCYNEKYYFAALKNQVNLGVSIVGMSKEEVKLFEGTGKTMRHLKIRSVKDINEKKIIKLLKRVKKPVHQ